MSWRRRHSSIPREKRAMMKAATDNPRSSGGGWYGLLANRVASRSRRGQVIVIVLLAMTLLVGLVFFVYNLGDQVNRRLAMQNTADAVAISGAGWMARSMNTIAMNNLAQARLLGIVPVLDALPLAVEMTLAELPEWEEALTELRDDLDRGSVAGLSRDERDILVDAINTLLAPYGKKGQTHTTKSDILRALEQLLTETNPPMEDFTRWKISGRAGSVPQGRLWQGFVGLHNFSLAVADSAGLLAQHNAVRYARANGAADGCLLPAQPSIPARRGEFEDFKPVLLGRLERDEDGDWSFEETVSQWELASTRVGGAIPDWADFHRLGPWGTESLWGLLQRMKWISGGGPLAGSAGNISMSGRLSGDDLSSPGRSEPVAPPRWHTYGPYSWALRTMSGYHELRGTMFYRYLERLADIKMGYMFEPPDELEEVTLPEWITEYDQAVRIAAATPNRIRRTRYYMVRILSSVPRGSRDWLGETTYTDPQSGRQRTVKTFRSNQNDPQVFVPSGWRNLADQGGDKLPGLPIWEDEWVIKYTELGLPAKYDDEGNALEQDLHVLDWWIFGGIDVGEDVEVENPCNYSQAEIAEFGPILLDTEQGDYEPLNPQADSGYRRERFTYLGMASRSTEAGVWPSRFTSAYPGGRMFTFAQAQVFNNVSWDLWTQEWQAQLVPVTKLEDWKRRMADAQQTTFVVDGKAVNLQPYNDFLDALPPELAARYLNH